jgi:hypothetical protein
MSVNDGSLGQKENKIKTLSVDDGSLGRKKKKKKPCPLTTGVWGGKKKTPVCRRQQFRAKKKKKNPVH